MIENTSANQAGAIATGIIGTLNRTAQFIASPADQVANGAAAMTMGPNQTPAVTAEQIATALGPMVTAKVQLISAVLNSTDATKLNAAITALA